MKLVYFLAFLIGIFAHTFKTDEVCPLDPDAEPFHGDATWYDWAEYAATGKGSCMYNTSGDHNIGAINHYQYDSGKACGKCAEIIGPTGDKLIVTIIDICMTCYYGDIDLGLDGFNAISGGTPGRVEITWRYVECPVDNLNFFYIFIYSKPETDNAFQMRIFNKRHPVRTFERYHEFEGETAEWFSLPRGSHGNWGVPKGSRSLGIPFRLRLTSNISGEVIEEQFHVLPQNNYIIPDGNRIVSKYQFASVCGPTPSPTVPYRPPFTSNVNISNDVTEGQTTEKNYITEVENMFVSDSEGSSDSNNETDSKSASAGTAVTAVTLTSVMAMLYIAPMLLESFRKII